VKRRPPLSALTRSTDGGSDRVEYGTNSTPPPCWPGRGGHLARSEKAARLNRDHRSSVSRSCLRSFAGSNKYGVRISPPPPPPGQAGWVPARKRMARPTLKRAAKSDFTFVPRAAQPLHRRTLIERAAHGSNATPPPIWTGLTPPGRPKPPSKICRTKKNRVNLLFTGLTAAPIRRPARFVVGE
jgi:hypothetical protein